MIAYDLLASKMSVMVHDLSLNLKFMMVYDLSVS